MDQNVVSDNTFSADRRRSPRVDTKIALLIREIPSENEESAFQQFEYTRNKFSIFHRFLFKTQEYHETLNDITTYYPASEEALGEISTKIYEIAKSLAVDNDEMPDTPTHDVDISLHGLGFRSNTPFKKQDVLELRIQIFPQRLRFLIYAEVVYCVPLQNEIQKDYALGVNFIKIHEEDRSLLTQHVLASDLV